MRRREFISLLGSTVAWPFDARAQQITKLPTVGFMGSATPSTYVQWINAFVERLHEHDWTEGRSVSIEYRWAEGSYERASEIAAEFVRMKVDVIVTSSTPNVLATKKATTEIPIIFASAGDPVAGGLVASLARPGGNITGLSIQAAEIAGKRIALLREALHPLSRLAIMGNGDNSAVVGEMRETQAAAKKLGLNATTFSIQRSEDIGPTFEKFKGNFDALYVPAEPLANTNWHNFPFAGDKVSDYSVVGGYKGTRENTKSSLPVTFTPAKYVGYSYEIGRWRRDLFNCSHARTSGFGTMQTRELGPAIKLSGSDVETNFCPSLSDLGSQHSSSGPP